MVKGDIYLVDFGKSKDSFSFGKIRPVIIYQTNKLNYAVKEGMYEYFVVIPLSTKDDILTNDFRVTIAPKENLVKKSFAVINSICFLHKRYFKQKLASISEAEKKKIDSVIGDLFEL